MRRFALAGLVILAAGLSSPAAAQSKLKEVESPGAARHSASAFRTDVVEVPLKAAGDPGKGHEIEYMVRMKAGDVLVYSLEAPTDANLWHEFHGHTPQSVTFYKKAAGPTHHGSLTAPFDGIHGWYYENRTKAPVTVRMKLSGFYELVPADKK
jgi:hypothetical protein